jgi:ABC-type lipoprotein export system ATPase subunit
LHPLAIGPLRKVHKSVPLSVVVVAYAGEIAAHALRDLDLEIFEGEFMLTLGHSGSEKSTLLSILGDIDMSTSGGAFCRDHDSYIEPQ